MADKGRNLWRSLKKPLLIGVGFFVVVQLFSLPLFLGGGGPMEALGVAEHKTLGLPLAFLTQTTTYMDEGERTTDWRFIPENLGVNFGFNVLTGTLLAVLGREIK